MLFPHVSQDIMNNISKEDYHYIVAETIKANDKLLPILMSKKFKKSVQRNKPSDLF
jgi:hypothetical protein